jgi:putative transposase
MPAKSSAAAGTYATLARLASSWGVANQDVCRHLEVSVQTYQRWRSQYKAMRPEDVVRLKALEKEDALLKRIVGEQALDIDMLREVSRGNF